MRTRKDIWKLAPGDQTLLWYARAIAEMQKRGVTDPTSWRYQAAIHDYDSSDDPLAVAGEQLPSQSEQDTYWARCQHGTWFFLPWHRAFLFYFEQILLQAIQTLGGPADWALPYWNYSDPSNPKARCLPPAFWAAKLPDGSANTLLVPARARGANRGQPLGSSNSAEITTCLEKPVFVNSSAGGATGFGGGRTGFSHSGNLLGELETVPHGSMHVAVGGPSGWMSAFNTAGLDPVFWLHHANIDRLWEVWLRRDASHTNPTLAAWLSAVSFDFHDAHGEPVTLTADRVLDTAKPLLDYVYEDVSDPLAAAAAAKPVAPAARAAIETPRIPEMVGASDTRQAIRLGSQPVSIQVNLQAPSGPAAKALQAGTTSRVHLNLENITAKRRPVESYLVFVNLPEGAKPEEHPELKAGLLPLFGVVEASRPTKEHAGDGLSHSFDITRIAAALQAAKSWNPAQLRVTFVPHRPESDPEPILNAQPVAVGRVSLYYE
ncbi:MAG TPA: tyrosinase family protein [Candidatus Acidoferrum sp.]|nr:tyrosinase family protein [Candidatus Acidoferrum sp.]